MRATKDQLASIRFLLTDVDGVLTDGRLVFDSEGNESKVYHVHDSAGFAYWHRAGFKAGMLSGRQSAAVVHHANSLGIKEVHLGHLDKMPIVLEIAQRQDLELHEIAYIGDDLLDIPVLQAVGFAASVSNGRREVLDVVHYVTNAAGGSGALREVVEHLLQAKGLWQGVVAGDGLS